MTTFGKVVAVAHQIKRERAAAKPLVSRLQSNTGPVWEGDVPPEWRNAGFVLELSSAASDILESNAATARELAQYAIIIAESIAPDAYPRPIRDSVTADAWKELANAHRYLSEYDAALRALSVAERHLADAPSADWERTLVRFARAVVLCDMHRLDEASILADETSAVFESYKEFRRCGHALLLKGMIAHRQGDFDAAATTFARAIDVLERTDDSRGLGSAYNNFGYAQAERGELASADRALQKALSIFEQLRFRGEAARTRCILASILLRINRFDRANELLATGRDTFRQLGMVEEAGIAGLSQADALLALGRPMEARTVIGDVLNEFRQASLSERAELALAYLQGSSL